DSMISAGFIVIFAACFQFTLALVEFELSTLYDETDFAKSVVIVPNCPNSRIFASVPTASESIAKKIMVHDYVHDEISLYQISKLSKGDQKGYHTVEFDIQQIKILNKNPGNATTPLAVWVVREQANDINDAQVYEAANLRIGPSAVDMITILSAEPYTLQAKTQGPIVFYGWMAGYDELPDYGEGGSCTVVISQWTPGASSDFQARVQSPILTLFYDDQDFEKSLTSINADVGAGKELDFFGLSFAASPGYHGCTDKRQYYSSLYETSTSFKYSMSKSYDISIGCILNTDDQNPVSVQDNSNKKEYKLSGTTYVELQLSECHYGSNK
ncbi:hypothetical protein PMAYCL1PPCAC_05480, partial [Pristionchus mayeri]